MQILILASLPLGFSHLGLFCIPVEWVFNIIFSLIISQLKFLGYSPDSLKQFISWPLVIFPASSLFISVIYTLTSSCMFLHVICYIWVILQAISSSWNTFSISFYKPNSYLMKYLTKEHKISHQTNLSSNINSVDYTTVWVGKVSKTLWVFKMRVTMILIW